jgi:hypothetical protein
MEIIAGKFRKSKGDFKRSTKRNFQNSKIQRPRLRGLLFDLGKNNFDFLINLFEKVFILKNVLK